MVIEIPLYLHLVWFCFWHYLAAWYWLFLFLILFWSPSARPYSFWRWWYWWRYQTRWVTVQMPKWIEIILPKDIVKPSEAMEVVLENIHKGFWEPARFWERWWKGKPDVFDFQFEMVSDGGKIRFYLRTFLGYKIDVLKSAIYSQYPGIEMREVEDYSRAIPADIPNKNWDVRAGDFTLAKPDFYPIATYKNWEKQAEVMTKEEKRIDPMAGLIEAMSDLKPGEIIWFQIKPFPISGKYAKPYVQQAMRVKDQIAQRRVPEKPKSFFSSFIEAIDTLITGPKKKGGEEAGRIELEAPELRMTPREREICAAIERKASKALFLVSSIRFVYMAKKEVYNYHRWRRILEFMGSFCEADMNEFKNLVYTYTKMINPPPLNLFDKRRIYVRKRRIIRLYQNRYEPKYPFGGDYKWGYFVLSSEELASVFHFPGRIMAPSPGIKRVGIKKAEAPPEVPME
ncbi:hypothetical protein J7J18_01295 [bacterium]|nr:hypothetical protein [bacterium]